MYDRNDRYKYGNNKYRYEQVSNVRYPKPRARAKAHMPIGTVVFMILFITAIAIGSFFLGMKTFETKYGVPSREGNVTERIVNVKSGDSEISEISAAAEIASASSVVITNETTQQSGSGFVYDNKGAIITCYHVIEKANQVKVKLSNGKVFYSSDIRGDEMSDIAVIMLKDSNGQPLNTKSSQINIRETDIDKTENILIIGQTGSAHSAAGAAIRATVTHNKMQKEKDFGYGECYEIENIVIRTQDIPLYHGLSGGFIADLNGNFAGMIYGMGTEDETAGYVIPAFEVRNIVDDLIEKRNVSGRPELYGVEFSQVDNPGEDRPHIGLYVAKINVDKIEDTSLVVNDYIVKAGGFEIKTEADWIEYLKTKKAGSTINIEVRRSGQTDTIPVILKLKQRQGNDIN